jgi:hypothetical protein
MKDNIPGFMGYYVSKTGSVYSRYVRGSRGKLSNEFTPLIPKKRPKYYSVSLYRDGKSTKIFVHRLVATVYVPNPNNLPVVMHLDNDIYNNYYKNLKWGTQKENTQQCIRDGRFKPGGRDILDEFSINCLLYEYNLGKPRSILKKKFGISDSAINRIINLKSKPKFGNYRFKAIYQDIIRDYQEGMLVRDICNKYSIGHTTLNNYLRRLNIIRHR